MIALSTQLKYIHNFYNLLKVQDPKYLDDNVDIQYHDLVVDIHSDLSLGHKSLMNYRKCCILNEIKIFLIPYYFLERTRL